MNKCNSRTRRCFKFQVQEFQSGPIELWITAAKFCKKFQSVLKTSTKYTLNFHEVECTPLPLCPHLSNFVELYSSYNTWTSYVIPLCGTIMKYIVLVMFRAFAWNFIEIALKLWSCWSYHSDRMTEFLLSFNFLLIFNP